MCKVQTLQKGTHTAAYKENISSAGVTWYFEVDSDQYEKLE